MVADRRACDCIGGRQIELRKVGCALGAFHNLHSIVVSKWRQPVVRRLRDPLRSIGYAGSPIPVEWLSEHDRPGSGTVDDTEQGYPAKRRKEHLVDCQVDVFCQKPPMGRTAGCARKSEQETDGVVVIHNWLSFH